MSQFYRCVKIRCGCMCGGLLVTITKRLYNKGIHIHHVNLNLVLVKVFICNAEKLQTMKCAALQGFIHRRKCVFKVHSTVYISETSDVNAKIAVAVCSNLLYIFDHVFFF